MGSTGSWRRSCWRSWARAGGASVTDTDPHEHLSRFHQRRAEAISRVPLLKRMEQRSLWAMALLGVPTASVFIWIGPDGAWFWALLGAAFLPQLWHAGAWVRLRH